MEIKKKEKTHMYMHYMHIFGGIESSSVCVYVWMYECVCVHIHGGV